MFEHYWRLGVRHFYLTHNIDGVAGGTALGIDLLHSVGNPSGASPGSGWLDRLGEVNRVIAGIRPNHTRQSCSNLYRYDGGVCNAKGLSPEGRELAKLMAAHGAIIDADHVSYKARRELLGTGDNSLLGGVYPLVSSHAGAAGLFTCGGSATCDESNESQLRDEDLEAIIRVGGAFGPRLPPVTRTAGQDTYPANATVAPHKCGGTTESYIQAYRYLVDFLKGKPQADGTTKGGRLLDGRPAFVGLGIGTDFGAPIPVYAAGRFAQPPGLVEGFIDIQSLIINMPPGWGHCYAESSSEPRLRYPFKSSSRLSLGELFEKSTTPWDGRATQPGYDVGQAGVTHIGMIPDFVEEMRVLGLTDTDLEPLWNGAEAYIRSWEAAEAWKSSFDVEAKDGKRAACEADRKKYVEGLEIGHIANAVGALHGLVANRCRGTP